MSINPQSESWRHVRKELIFVLALSLFALFVFSFFSFSPGGDFRSVELKFTDPSVGGLAIVPASCPSDAHFEGQCGSTINTQYSCAISADPHQVDAGNDSTLVWAIRAQLNVPRTFLDWSLYYSLSPWPPVASSQEFGPVGQGRGTSGSGFPGYGGLVFIGDVTPSPFSYYPVADPGAEDKRSGGQGGSVGLVSMGTLPVTPPQTTSYVLIGTPPKQEQRIEVAGFLPGSQGTPRSWCYAQLLVGEGTTTPNAFSCSPGYYCSASDLYYKTTQCTDQFIQTCTYGCSGGACLGVPPPSGSIQVAPQLLRSGELTQVTWSATNVSSCSVSGNNGNSWTGTSGSQISSPIVTQTVYTLSCAGLDGSTFIQSATVNLIPIFQET